MWWFVILVGLFAFVLVREVRKDGRQIVAAVCAVALTWLLYGKVQALLVWIDTDGKGGLAQAWRVFMESGGAG